MMSDTFSHLVVVLFAVLLSSSCCVVEGFATNSPLSAAAARSSSSSLLRLSVEDALQSIPVGDALELLKSGAAQLENTVSSAESPSELIAHIPLAVKAAGAAVVGLPAARTASGYARSYRQLQKNKASEGKPEERTYPEGKPATYEMNDNIVPFESGDAAFVRPLLKQTQLETRPLQVVYDANRHGYDPKVFHARVDGKGAAVVLAKCRGKWFGGYNPRGWASLGAARSSVAAFLFYKTLGGWQKLRASRTGSMACGNDLYDEGIFFGADGLVMPLASPRNRQVTSRLGQYFESCPDGRNTVLPKGGGDFQLQELRILTGVYAPGEDIPNSGGVLELGFF